MVDDAWTIDHADAFSVTAPPARLLITTRNLLRAIEVSIEGLESADRERYLDLSVFPEDHPIPEEALRVLWNLNDVDTRDCMTQLVARSLATCAVVKQV